MWAKCYLPRGLQVKLTILPTWTQPLEYAKHCGQLETQVYPKIHKLPGVRDLGQILSFFFSFKLRRINTFQF